MKARDSAPVGEANSALSPRDERAVTDNGWQPIETAPRDGTYIILGWASDGHIEMGLFLGGSWRGDQSGYWRSKDHPTDWQPLPKAPSKDRGEAPNNTPKVRG